jgi:hypothetical protein
MLHVGKCPLHSAEDDAVEAVHLLAVGLVAVGIHQGEQVLLQLLLLTVAVLMISSPVR